MKKLNIAYIVDDFKKYGYNLLTTEYINSKQKLKYICPVGHVHFIRWNNWQQGQRCPSCAGLCPKNIEDIKYLFGKEGYILLSTKYKNAFTKLQCVCPNGHEFITKWNYWQQGNRCPMCANENKKEKKNPFYGKKHSIKTRIRMSLNHADVNASNNPRWLGGVSYEPYCSIWSDFLFKESIKSRDNHKCQNPDCWHKDGSAGQLSIHHIDYNKKNCDPTNLITLCRSCNSRANSNREYWQSSFERIIRTNAK